MEKIGKLRGPRGGELMYAVLTKHNTRKRGAEDGARGGDGSKRPRQVSDLLRSIAFIVGIGAEVGEGGSRC